MAKSYRFEPKTIQVEAGDRNLDERRQLHPHGAGRRPGGPRGRPGDSVSITFDEPGTYDYVCTLHSHDMDGTVIVT